MDVPLPATILLIHLVLVAAGLIIFLPEGGPRPGARSGRRLVDRYGAYAVPGLIVLAVHAIVVQLDGSLTERLGWDFTPLVAEIEGDAVLAFQALWNPFLNGAFSVLFLLVHPWMVYFAALLFVLSDEERAAKAVFLMYPLAYAMALPFFLFFPVFNAFTFHQVATPVAEFLPAIWSWYFDLTSANNTFPSLHVAFALLLANATRYSRNVRFRYFTFAYAALLVLAVLYLNVHWFVDVLGGAAVAVFAATLTRRIISVERLALQRVKPTPEEAQAVTTAANDIVGTARRHVKELNYPAKIMLVGSAAKDTYLASRVDFDVFLLFPPDMSRKDLEQKGLTVGYRVIPDGEEKYAEHPYVHGRWKRWEADVVPAYEVASASERMSAVDRTPFHTRFVMERLTRGQRDEVRLLKQFMVGIGAYGAEAAVRGFSGYLCELLVLKYGTFRGVVDAGAKWKPGTYLALETHEGNPRFADPLVFLDPVDPGRNAASAVSEETLTHFTDACKAYLHREGLSFFFPRQLVPLPPVDVERMVRRRRGEFVLLTLPRPDVLEDHLHDQLRKASTAVTGLLERHEFNVKRVTTHVAASEVQILFEITRLRLSEGIVHTGPPVKARDHAERFRKRWTDHPEALSEVYEEKGRLRVKRRREFRRAEDLMRVKLRTVDLGKHLNAAAKERFSVRANQEASAEDTVMIFTRHFNWKKPWEL